jgi:hypothetical protein
VGAPECGPVAATARRRAGHGEQGETGGEAEPALTARAGERWSGGEGGEVAGRWASTGRGTGLPVVRLVGEAGG